MTVEQWVFKRGAGGTDFTSSVISFSGNAGRQTYLDNYSGGTFQITIKNQANEAANFTRGTQVRIVWEDNLIFLDTAFIGGTVIGVTFSDYPGNTGLSTATIVCQDELTRAGKFTLQNFTGYTQMDTCQQGTQTNNSISGLDTPDISFGFAGQSIAQAVTNYNGTILNRLNLLNNTERGSLVAQPVSIIFLSRGDVLSTNLVSFHRSTSSSTSIAYTALRRINALNNFYNQVTVNSTSAAGTALAPVFGNNTVSQTANGVAGFEFESADQNSTQATGLASWISFTQGDPTTLRFEIDIDDATADYEAISLLFFRFIYFGDLSTSITWRVPGDVSDTTTNIVFEGFSYSGVPGKTSYTLYFSPATYYQYFTLNSSTLGILDTSRLGW